ncbi:conserved protein of unknown function [Pseudomonas marincola]|uniref:Uncharacterized protein n=1 Tax=Pseudomonas marincola TaxID=437900 RepID=A0A653DZC3_9PSED|nr:conserved protein of unknown function [Pseudomonas marincola]
MIVYQTCCWFDAVLQMIKDLIAQQGLRVAVLFRAKFKIVLQEAWLEGRTFAQCSSLFLQVGYLASARLLKS